MNREPLTNNEYYALRELFGVVNSFERCAGALEHRSRKIKGGWRDMAMIKTVSMKLMNELLQTVPEKKLMMIRQDLKNARFELNVVRDYTGQAGKEGFSYVPDSAVTKVVERLISYECVACDKNAAEAKKCKVLKDIEKLYAWEMPPKNDGCVLQGAVLPTED